MSWQFSDEECEHAEWRAAALWPNILVCAECGARRDLLPQHHLYRTLVSEPYATLCKIDLRIVEVVKLAWESDLETTGSCEGGCYDRWRAQIELRTKDQGIALELFAALPDVRFEELEEVLFMTFEPQWRCPMYEQEREAVEKSGGRTTRDVIR